MRIATCRFRGPLGNATARAVFRATAEYAGATMRDPSGSGALRFELMEHKTADDSGDFSALTVHWHQPPEADPGLPGWLAAEVDVRSAQRLRTVFPERSRWKEAVPIAEPGELGEVGRIALLVQRSVLVAADADAADQLRRGWADLGYNALGEPGVVRCDLFVYDDDPLTFVARKVFRGPQALRAHEGSDHFVRWREVCSRCPARPAACVCQPHTNAALACHTRMPHAHAARTCRTHMPHSPCSTAHRLPISADAVRWRVRELILVSPRPSTGDAAVAIGLLPGGTDRALGHVASAQLALPLPYPLGHRRVSRCRASSARYVWPDGQPSSP